MVTVSGRFIALVQFFQRAASARLHFELHNKLSAARGQEQSTIAYNDVQL